MLGGGGGGREDIPWPQVKLGAVPQCRAGIYKHTVLQAAPAGMHTHTRRGKTCTGMHMHNSVQTQIISITRLEGYKQSA